MRFGTSSAFKPTHEISGKIWMMQRPVKHKQSYKFEWLILKRDKSNHIPRPNNLRSLSMNQYFDTTTGWMELWLWTAIWKAPFLNGNKWSRWLRVPSGKINTLALCCWISTTSWFNLFIAVLWFERSMNRVPQSHAAGPKGKTNKSSFFAIVVARPISGHKCESTKRNQQSIRLERVSFWLVFFWSQIKQLAYRTYRLDSDDLSKPLHHDFYEYALCHAIRTKCQAPISSPDWVKLVYCGKKNVFYLKPSWHGFVLITKISGSRVYFRRI